MMSPNEKIAEQPGVLKSLPRRQVLETAEIAAPLSQMRFLEFKFSRLAALRNTVTWVTLLTSYYFSVFFGALRGRNQVEQRAQALRRAFEQRGGAFVKLGIHLSVRFDLLPWSYCAALANMTDRMAPFSVELAVRQVENAIKGPLQSIFVRFDPEPINSTSIACIYQAQLHSGKRVIVKVRRPNVGPDFMAALQAFGWLIGFAEFLTIFKPGYTKRLLQEYRTYALEQLDFIQEARRQDAFRRSAQENPSEFFSAPQVYLDLSNDEVVVEEFVSGMWLSELIEAFDCNDESLLERARSLNIKHKKVARRLLWIHYWALETNLFFPAEPHPRNIIVAENGCLYFVNFENTGSLDQSKRQALQQFRYYVEKRDPQNMARALLILLEPLPPLDVLELTAELESFNWQYLYSLEAAPNSLAAEERTSILLWQGLLDIAKKHRIFIDTNVLLLIRATLINETAAVRLHHEVDFLRVYRQFEDFRAEQARKRVVDSILDQMDGEMNESLIIRLDRIAYTLQGFFFRTRHMLALPSVNFSTLMGKWSFATFVSIRFFFQLLLLTGAALLFSIGVDGLSIGQVIDPKAALTDVLIHPLYQVLALILFIANWRAVLFRLDDIDLK